MVKKVNTGKYLISKLIDFCVKMLQQFAVHLNSLAQQLHLIVSVLPANWISQSRFIDPGFVK